MRQPGPMCLAILGEPSLVAIVLHVLVNQRVPVAAKGFERGQARGGFQDHALLNISGKRHHPKLARGGELREPSVEVGR